MCGTGRRDAQQRDIRESNEFPAVTMKNVVFWDTSQETHYISAKELSQLILCKILGFHGSDYEERRLLGYKNPVRTSPETHYVSTTESSQ
jgi:hypothetical protein